MKRILLIVDDMPAVARSIARYLRPVFDQVVVACTLEQAVALLDDPEEPPTHLLIDQFLGWDCALGSDMVAVWRARYPQLRVAVVLTGADSISVRVGSGVDLVLRKPPDVRALRDYFGNIPA